MKKSLVKMPRANTNEPETEIAENIKNAAQKLQPAGKDSESQNLQELICRLSPCNPTP